jgi:hypothetical protein
MSLLFILSLATDTFNAFNATPNQKTEYENKFLLGGVCLFVSLCLFGITPMSAKIPVLVTQKFLSIVVALMGILWTITVFVDNDRIGRGSAKAGGAIVAYVLLTFGVPRFVNTARRVEATGALVTSGHMLLFPYLMATTLTVFLAFTICSFVFKLENVCFVDAVTNAQSCVDGDDTGFIVFFIGVVLGAIFVLGYANSQFEVLSRQAFVQAMNVRWALKQREAAKALKEGAKKNEYMKMLENTLFNP